MKNLVIIFSFFISGITIAQIPNYVPTNDLLCWWPLNGNAQDLSQNNLSGTCFNTSSTNDRFGNPCSAIACNGVELGGGSTILSNSASFNIGQNAYTINLWFKPNNITQVTRCLFNTDPHTGIGIAFNDNNAPGYLVYDVGPANAFWNSLYNHGAFNSFQPNVWYCMTFVKAGTTFSMYINGILDHSINLPISASYNYNVTWRLSGISNLYQIFNGDLDDFGFWNRALTQSEINSLYQSTFSVVTPISSVNAGPDQTVCSGAPVTLTASGASTYSWTGGIQNGVPFTPTTSGTYIVTGTNSNGCIGTDTVNISVIPTPIISVTQDTICAGQTTTLTASSTSSASGCLSLTGSLNTGLVGYWPFCGNANDETVNNNNGIVYGATLTTDRFGVANNAYSFNGVNSYIDVPHSTSLNIVNSYSIEFWVYNLNNTGGWYSTVSKDNWFSNQGFINYIAATVIASVNCAASNHATTTLPINAWIHIAVTYENNTLKVYKNGSLVATENQSFANATTSLRFGARHQNDGTGITNFFFGKLDDIGLWNRALTPSEIQQLYSLGQATYSWTPGGATTPSITVSPASTTTYSCDVTNSNGVTCTVSQQVVVAPFQVNAGPDLTVLPGTQVSLTASGATTYTWTGGISNGISFTANTTQTYIVTGTNSAGCVASDTVTVNVVSSPSINISSSSPVVCLGDSITLTSQLVQSVPLSLSFPYSKLNGNEIWVSPSGSNQTGTGTYNNPFQTIQYAIGQAANGQIVTLKNGTYSGTGNVNISLQGKQITVQSENGPLNTILDCNQSGRGFIANSGETMNTLIKGIQIKNGKTNAAPLGYASAIFVEDNSGLKIIECIFQSNIEGCIRFGDTEVSGPQSAIENCAFIQNQQSCITADKKSFYTESCFFYGNTSTGDLFGNGHVANPAQYYQNCVLKCNSGNIIGALGHGKLMSNSLFIGNTSTQGTIYMGTNWSGTNTIDHCTFYNNTCNYYNSGWYDHTGQVLSSIFYPGDARNHVSGNQGQIPFSNSLGNNITGNGNIQGNPLFVNPGANNFNLQSGSPCLGTGASGTNMGANPNLIQPWLFSFLDYYSQAYSTITWENGAQTPSITISPTTSDYISVTYSGCGTQITDSIFVQVTNLTSVDAGLDQNICPGSSVTLTATGASTYVWSGGVQNGVPFVPSVSGTYIVTGTNSNGCTNSDTVIVTVNNNPTISSVVNNVLCFGGSTGSINTTIANGMSPYTVSWNSGQTTSNIQSLVAGNYTINVTDNNGCTATATYNVQSPSALQLSGLVSSSNCSNVATGAIDLTVIGGLTPYSTLWSTGAVTQDLQNIGGGMYTVQVTDMNGCVVNDTFQVSQSTAIQVTSSVINPTCSNLNNGQIDISITGGTPAFAYSWSNGQTNQDLTNIGVGNYSLTVTDALGCLSTVNFNLSAPAPLNITFNSNTIGCYGAATGQINSTVSGGVQPYSYFWSNGATTPNLNNVVAGNYTLTVNDAGGCAFSASSFVQQPSNPLIITAIVTPINCNGASTGAIDVTVTGGTMFYSYAWNNGSINQDLQNIGWGSYSLNIVDGNGCIYDTIFYVSQPTNALASQISQVNVSCQNGGNGSIDLTVTGGQIPYNYIWTNGATTQDLIALSAGTYSVIITDGNGCMKYDTISITQPLTSFSLSVNITNVACFGASTGTIDLIVSGGTGPYTYIWSNGGSSQDLNNLSAGSYNVLVYDIFNCQTTQTFTLTQPVFALQASALVTNLICASNPTGSIDVSVTGGTSPYTYLWSNGQTTLDLLNVGAGTYSLTISDNNGCQISLSETINAPSQPLNTTALPANASCFGYSDGQISLTTTGGVTPYTYLWSNGQNTNLVDSLPAGIYNVIVTDFNGCENNLSIQINQPNEILNSFQPSSTFGCFPAEIQFTYPVNDPSLTFTWNFGNGTTSSLQNPSVLYEAAGCFDVSLTVTADNGCSVTNQLDSLICMAQGPKASFYSTTSSIDFYTGELSLFDDSEGSIISYLWTLGDSSPNQTSQNIIHYYTPYIQQDYNITLTVTDSNGCTDVASMIFSLTEEFEIYVPNTITINGDNLNEGLLPIFSNVDIMQDYEMSIYNRWGNLVWQTTNPSEPWYGRYKDSKDVQTGVYTWKIKYTDNKQVTRTLVGHVNVLR